MDYNHLPRGSSPNMVAAIAVFYVLALCQGALYITASILGFFSSFPRQWLIRRSKLGIKKLGAKAIDLYYERAYATRMEMGVFGASGSSIIFADFAIESLTSSSSSRDVQVAGLCVLHNILLERPMDGGSTQDLIHRVTSGSGDGTCEGCKGKQLESLINLASEIGDVTREAFVHELESQTNDGAGLIQKLVDTLDSKKIPHPEYPRMRRVIVKILISILKSCHRKEGMTDDLRESLTKVERAPSGVEDYRVFYGNIGVVPEDGEPMSALVSRAKVLLVQRTTQTAGAPTGDDLLFLVLG